MKKWPLFFIALLPIMASAYSVRKWTGSDETLSSDLILIQKKANWNQHSLSFSRNTDSETNQVQVQCNGSNIHLVVQSTANEHVSTLYHALFKMGFLFPHPRWQISPTEQQALSHCGKTFEWHPAFPERGFHLHTLHPNEWVKGFLEGDEEIALDMVRWLARNRQNVLDLSLMRPEWTKQKNSLKKPFALAKNLGITRGVSLGAAFQQQNSFKLVPMFEALSGRGDKVALLKSIHMLNKALDYDFMTMEIGTSEFTAMNYERALAWIDIAAAEMKKEGKKLFTKVHVSTNQIDPKWGNFNFLPRYASADVGVLPHTVMFYGLEDSNVPMYGNKNFFHMMTFMQEEKNHRDVWYYPETSYWVGMDADVPLFLTDYLRARASDMKLLHPEGIRGHFNFTSGQELGNWLFDWNVCLNSDLDLNFDPLAGLKLLGEDEAVWTKILDFQTKHFKENQLIAILSFSNVQDELSSGHRIHERKIIKEVAHSAVIRESEILKLETALKEVPDLTEIKNEELRGMLKVTELRIHHALAVRKSLRFKPESQGRENLIREASKIRLEAKSILAGVRNTTSRYPSSNIFEKDKNITSYDFGYLWTAVTLHFWEREELMVKNNNYFPFFNNIYDVFDIVF